MLTENELNISNQSYTNKDFYQVYPELINLVKTLSKRWDPQYTNESDPGLVLLKSDAFIADKLNYNIDKQILEVYLPSATQIESMRKICAQMGYKMKYYQSATGTVSFMCINKDALTKTGDIADSCIYFPAFTTVVTNEDNTITYTLVEDVTLNHVNEVVSAKCVEGQYVELSINSDNIILYENLSNNRFYLPETSIAENGIWITDSSDSSISWQLVDNLNLYSLGNYVASFEYDSKLNKPYLQFPEDAASLLVNGIKIAYIRTSGVNGNVSAKVLTTLEQSSVDVFDIYGEIKQDSDGNNMSLDISEDNFIIANSSAINNGCDMESLDEAYEGYKKTIGLLNTLVTTDDYAKYIYSMVWDKQTNNTPLVSNVQVSDSTDDVNKMSKIVTFDGFGVSTQNVADLEAKQIEVYLDKDLSTKATGTYYAKQAKITEFDLMLYPLKPISVYNSNDEYNESFRVNSANTYEIKSQLADYKALTHQLKQTTDNNDLYLIKNYYSLNAKIITTKKVTSFESLQIKNNIFNALRKNFNARKLDYGQAIPYDTFIEVIQNSDSRIRHVIMDDPEIETYYMLAAPKDGIQEGKLKFVDNFTTDSQNKTILSQGQKLYIKLAAKNVLAGRIPLFRYNTDLKVSYNRSTAADNTIIGSKNNYVGNSQQSGSKYKGKPLSITAISTNLQLPISVISNKTYKFKENEVLQILSPKLQTTDRYSVYVNYCFNAANTKKSEAIAANMALLEPQYLKTSLRNYYKTSIAEYYNSPDFQIYMESALSSGNVQNLSGWKDSSYNSPAEYGSTFKNLIASAITVNTNMLYNNSSSVYKKSSSPNRAKNCGYLIDSNQYVYKELGSAKSNGFKYTASDSDTLAFIPVDSRVAYFKRVSKYASLPEDEVVDAALRTAVDGRYIAQYKRYVKTTDSSSYINAVCQRDSWEKCTEEDYINAETLKDAVKNADGSIVIRSQESKKMETGEFEWDTTTDNVNFCPETLKNPNAAFDYTLIVTTTYYKVEYTEGVDAVSDLCIPANSEYQFTSNESTGKSDELYINYTDSDGLAYNIKYKKDSSGKWGKWLNGVRDTDFGDQTPKITTTFDLYDSSDWHSSGTGHSYSKTNGYDFGDDTDKVNGMFSLSSEQEIDERAYAKTLMKKTVNLYWSCNNSNTLTFKRITKEAGYAEFEYILDNGEYLFYTDDAKINLLTFGSGTRLVYRTVISSEMNQTSISWKITANSEVDLDQVANNGLAAFANQDWQVKRFDENTYLTLQQMNITTVTEGDTLAVSGTYAESIFPSITYLQSTEWSTMGSTDNLAYLLINNKSYLNFINYNDNSLKARTIYNINMGPNLSQVLYAPTTEEPVYRSIICYTSKYQKKVSDGVIKTLEPEEVVNELINNPSIITETIQSTPIAVFGWSKDSTSSNTNDISLQSNYDLGLSGGQLINTHIYSSAGTLLDDLSIYQYKSSNATYALDVNDCVWKLSELVTQTIENSTGVLKPTTGDYTINVDASTGKLAAATSGNSVCQFNKTTKLSFTLNAAATIKVIMKPWVSVESVTPQIKINDTVIDLVNKTEQECTYAITGADTITIESLTDNNYIGNININYSTGIDSRKTLNISTVEGAYSNFALSGVKDLIIPFYIPEQHYAVFSVYYTQTDNEATKASESIKVTTVNSSGTQLSKALLKFMNSSDNYKKELTLTPGLNIIKILSNEDIHLKLDVSNCTGALAVLGNSLIKWTYKSGSTTITDDGINYEELGVSFDSITTGSGSSAKTKTGIDLLLEEIKELDFNNLFYYNCQVQNNRRIDCKTLDSADAWFDKNNVANKFTLAQLDTESFIYIDIAKNSLI